MYLRGTQVQETEVSWETETTHIRPDRDLKQKITENHQDWKLYPATNITFTKGVTRTAEIDFCVLVKENCGDR